MLQGKTASTFSKRESHNLTEYDWQRIEFRVGRLMRQFCLTVDDADDLRQTMALEICKALGRYDPRKSSRNTYVNRTLDCSYRHITRQIRTHRKHAAWCPCPMANYFDVDSEHNRFSNGDIDELTSFELRHDIAIIIETLPPRLRRIASALMLLKPREAADQLGLHPSTVYRAIERLREHFAGAGWIDRRQKRSGCRCR